MESYARFKKDIECESENFKYKEGEKYLLIESSAIPEDYLIRQPNSPNGKDWWSRFDKKSSNEYFDIVEE